MRKSKIESGKSKINTGKNIKQKMKGVL